MLFADVVHGRAGADVEDQHARDKRGDLPPLYASGVADMRAPDDDGVPVADEQAEAEDDGVRVKVPVRDF
jgi:hypothetical protein